MSIFVGGSEVTEIKIGSTTINEVYVGSQLVYSANHRLTQGIKNVSTGSFRGFSSFDSPTYGSISPSTLNGVNILAVRAFSVSVFGNTAYYFSVSLAGSRSQNFFTSVSESSLGQKNTNNLFNYAIISTGTTWTWALPSMPANWDGSGVLDLDFV